MSKRLPWTVSITKPTPGFPTTSLPRCFRLHREAADFAERVRGAGGEAKVERQRFPSHVDWKSIDKLVRRVKRETKR